jgi:hypothetical protein
MARNLSKTAPAAPAALSAMAAALAAAGVAPAPTAPAAPAPTAPAAPAPTAPTFDAPITALREAFDALEGKRAALWPLYLVAAHAGHDAKTISEAVVAGIDDKGVKIGRQSTCRNYAKFLRDAGGIAAVPAGTTQNKAAEMAAAANKAAKGTATPAGVAAATKAADTADGGAVGVAAGWTWGDGVAAELARFCTVKGRVHVTLDGLIGLIAAQPGLVLIRAGVLPTDEQLDLIGPRAEKAGWIVRRVPTAPAAPVAVAPAAPAAPVKVKRTQAERAADAVKTAKDRAQADADLRGLTPASAAALIADAVAKVPAATRRAAGRKVAAKA